MSTPQNVTTRYATNLLTSGQNNDYFIKRLERMSYVHDGEIVGQFYIAGVQCLNMPVKVEEGSGATPTEAVRRALQKHGVIFT